MAEERRDGLQAHAAVDRLGGQGVPELVGMDMGQAGGSAGPVDHPGDGVPVQGPAVLPGQQQRMIWRDVPGPVGIDKGDQLGVQRQVAVLAQLADRDVQPRPRADQDHGISREAGELTDPQSGAQQHLHGDAYQHPAVAVGSAQQLRGGGVIEGPGQRMVLAGQVTGEHRHPGRGFVPAPFIDPDEEHPQRAEPVRDRGRGHGRLVLPGPGRQPGLERLNMPAGDLGQASDMGWGLGQERGKAPQCHVGVHYAARPEHAGDLLQVAAHRLGDSRDLGCQLVPGRQQQRPAHRAPAAMLPGSSWASMASAALRY